jgi:hypothetical protein
VKRWTVVKVTVEITDKEIEDIKDFLYKPWQPSAQRKLAEFLKQFLPADWDD